MDADPGQGDLELISSRRNPLVGRLRALHQGRGRREQQRLLLEGTHLLQEVLRLGLRPDWLLATAPWMDRHDALLAQLRQGAPQGASPSGGDSALQLRVVSEEVLAAVATTEQPDGVVVTLPLEQLPQPRAWPASNNQPGDSPKQEPPPDPFPSFVLALDRLQDPGNLGTLLRCALAAGVEEVWLAGGADPHQPKALRSSSGAVLALPLIRLEAAELAVRLDRARRSGLQVVAAVLPSPAWPHPPPYWRHDWTRPTVLLLGNEGAGVDPGLLEPGDAVVTIPHSPAVESLNVGVAAAPLLLERWRQAAGGGVAGS